MMQQNKKKCSCCGKQTMGEWVGNTFVIRHGGHELILTVRDFMVPYSGNSIDAPKRETYSVGAKD